MRLKVYPEIICERTSSNAERLIFDYFKKCDLPGYHVFHSLLLPRHPDKYIGETDFLVLSKNGILIIEIKGGLLETKNGNWTVTTETGKIKALPESPFSQATGNMYAVLNAMKDAGMPFVYRRNVLGCGVIFPNCKFDCKGIDIERELLLDARDFKEKNPLASFILQLEHYWKAKIGRSQREICSDNIKTLINWFRPVYHSVPSLRVEHLTLKNRMVALLDEQLDFLETAKRKRRIICSGGAGSGKTLVGLEYARQKIQEGYETTFIAPNTILETYIKSRGYSKSWIQPLSQLTSIPDAKYDWMVVDESQDIMSFEGFTEIDRVLKKGIEKGNWLILCDNQNQTGIDGNFEEDFYKYMNKLLDIEIILPRNIRNTLQIIDNTQSLTGKFIGKRGTGQGKKVDYIQYRNIKDASIKVAEIIENLVRKDLETSDILILGRSEGKNSELLTEIKQQGVEMIELNLENIGQYPFSVPAYSTIRNFKGLESYVVILDLSEFQPNEFDHNEMYVALTRPVGMLFLLYHKRMKKLIGKIQMQNLDKIKGKQ